MAGDTTRRVEIAFVIRVPLLCCLLTELCGSVLYCFTAVSTFNKILQAREHSSITQHSAAETALQVIGRITVRAAMCYEEAPVKGSRLTFSPSSSGVSSSNMAHGVVGRPESGVQSDLEYVSSLL